MSFASLFAASALASLAFAAPLTDSSAKKDFVVHQDVPKTFIAPQIQLARAYAKFGATPPAHVLEAAAAAGTSSGTVTANPVNGDSEYVCAVTLGSTSTTLDFDTGSADLWTFSTLQPSSQTSGHTLYTPVAANIESGESWQISYGDGSGAQGTVYADKVVIGGVTVTGQAVEAATSASSEFVSDTSSNGLVGLAFSSINTCSPQQKTTFFDTAIAQKVLSKNLFTADLKKGKPGAYTFGFIDTSRYTGNIAYTGVDSSNGFWQFTPSSYSVGSGGAVTSQNLNGIADTGTTLLLIQDAVLQSYYSQVSGATNSRTYGGYVFPCSATLPNFSLTIGGQKFTVPGSYINYAQVSSTKCYGGLQSSSGVGFNIYGDIFLKAVYAVFDKSTGSPRLGFASKST